MAEFQRNFRAKRPFVDGTLERISYKEITVEVKLSGKGTEDIRRAFLPGCPFFLARKGKIF